MRMIRLAGVTIFLSMVALAAACGGSQHAEPEQAPAAVTEPTPQHQETQRAAAERDERIWYAFYKGMHALTIYPVPGPIRSYTRQATYPPFGERHPQFSVISEYADGEQRFAPVISRADGVEELIELLEAMEDVEVDEDVNPHFSR